VHPRLESQVSIHVRGSEVSPRWKWARKPDAGEAAKKQTRKERKDGSDQLAIRSLTKQTRVRLTPSPCFSPSRDTSPTFGPGDRMQCRVIRAWKETEAESHDNHEILSHIDDRCSRPFKLQPPGHSRPGSFACALTMTTLPRLTRVIHSPTARLPCD
jgi:hypothetical protein